MASSDTDPRAPSRRPSRTEIRTSTLAVGDDALIVVSFPSPFALQRHPALTGAEREVAAGLLEGLSNAEIARRRGTSVRTVANQVASLYRKLQVASRAELAAALRP